MYSPLDTAFGPDSIAGDHLVVPGVSETAPIDTRSCTTVAWSYTARPPSTAQAYDEPSLLVYAFNGTDWDLVDAFQSGSHFQPLTRTGLITGATAQVADFRLRFEPQPSRGVLSP